MSNQNIKSLNKINELLIDSQKGFEKGLAMVTDYPNLEVTLAQKKTERETLIGEFKTAVRLLGEEPVEDGSAMGAVHRGWVDFTSMFQQDAKAAFAAIDDGEEYIAKQIDGELENDDLDVSTRALLQKALTSTRAGQAFASKSEELLAA